MLLTVETKMRTSYMLLNETAFHVTGVCSRFINQYVAYAYGYTDPCKCVKVYLCDSWGFVVGGVFFAKDNSRLFFLEVFQYWRCLVIRYECKTQSELLRLFTLLPLMCFTWTFSFSQNRAKGCKISWSHMYCFEGLQLCYEKYQRVKKVNVLILSQIFSELCKQP